MEQNLNWLLVGCHLGNFGAISNLVFDYSRLVGSNGWYEHLLTVFCNVRMHMPIDVDPFLVLHIAEAFAMHPSPRMMPP